MPRGRKTSSSTPADPIHIGDCEVTVEARKYTFESNPNRLQISINRNTRIKISVREDNDNQTKKAEGFQQTEGDERVEKDEGSCSIGDIHMFLLVNPKDADGRSKCYLQEVLKMYKEELPAMNYAANTGKQSMFLDRCVSNGKYSTLLLKSKAAEESVEVVAAITYQIVPADTQYAEVPLAAVSSNYQHKGFGHFLYMELRKRLQSVGIRTIYCWGDKESEGFWIKQGFTSIAEVDRKGRARRLPIKADVRRALCFPGGATLMVSHLNEGTSDNIADSLNFCFPQKPRSSKSPSHDLETTAPSKEGELKRKTVGEEPANFGEDTYIKLSSPYTRGTKRMAWEATLSSLKSKKVKGSQRVDCELDSSWGLESGSHKTGGSSFDRCISGISKGRSFVEGTPGDPLTGNTVQDNVKEGTLIDLISEDLIDKRLQSNGQGFRIMLMNIADSIKKMHLTKVIEALGGDVTTDGSVSTHVVTGKARTTLNFCTALCSGAWIVSSSWLKESHRKGKFEDESPYLLCDEDYALQYRTELKNAVLRSRARPGALLKGYDICIGSHARPPVKTLSAIVKSAGGNIIRGLDKVNDVSKTIFIACEEDMEEALSAANEGIWTFSSDWLMNCIMRQELDFEVLQFAASL